MVRKGQISSVDYEKCRAAVAFAEDDGTEQATREVSADFALLLALEYNMPNVDDWVTVLCFDDAPEWGVVLPRISSEKFKPEFEGRKGLFRRWFGRSQKKCYVEYADPENGGGNDGKFIFHNDDDARAEAKNVEIEADEDVSMKARGKAKIEAPEIIISASSKITIEAPQGNITFNAGDVVAAMVSLVNHPHPFVDVTPGGPVPSVTESPLQTGG